MYSLSLHPFQVMVFLQKIYEQSSGERSFSKCLDETVGFVVGLS